MTTPPPQPQPVDNPTSPTPTSSGRTPNPTYDRAPANVPDDVVWYAQLGARLHSGSPARDLVRDIIDGRDQVAGGTVAADIEATGKGAAAFTVRCVTFAWESVNDDEIHSVILDPRRDEDRPLIRGMFAVAPFLLFHGSPYDVPPLYALGLLTLEDINRVMDTLVLARMTYPDTMIPKSLEKLCARPELLGIDSGGEVIDTAFRAAGYRNKSEGFAKADLDMPVYRIGAMADTVATLRLGPVIYNQCVQWLTGSNLPVGETTPNVARAHDLIGREITVNRVMLRRSAQGLKVDADYLDNYISHVSDKRDNAAKVIAETISDEAVGRGDKIIEHLDKIGELPDNWPRTPTGRLKADKDAFEKITHPLIDAHRTVADTDHVLDYLYKSSDMASITGRVHPQVNVLGASATGRMSYSEPELQQFPEDARPILVPDHPGEQTGWVSLDFKAIEPVVMANCAGDSQFLYGFETNGDDLYKPIVDYAGVDRPTAKVVILATLYGQGITSLAARLGVSGDEARETRNKVMDAMPMTRQLIDNITTTARGFGEIMTADGRRLYVPKDKQGQVMAYKAVNYFCQGTAYSILAESIVNLEHAGLGDHIHLAVHDELVVDAAVQEEVQRIMSTPPDWLCTFAGRTPVIRVDDNLLPECWLKV